MSGETEPWNPSAEPWEALNEAAHRAIKKGVLRRMPSDIAAALSEMGWSLIPSQRIESAGTYIASLEGEQSTYEDLLERAEARVRQLEEALRIGADLLRASGNGYNDEVAASWERLLDASSPAPDDREYVEAFERARRRVESEDTDVHEGDLPSDEAPAPVPEKESSDDLDLRPRNGTYLFTARYDEDGGEGSWWCQTDDGSAAVFGVGPSLVEALTDVVQDMEGVPAPVPSRAKLSRVARAAILRGLAAEVRRELVPGEEVGVDELHGSLGEAIGDATGFSRWFDDMETGRVAEGIARWIESQVDVDPAPVPEGQTASLRKAVLEAVENAPCVYMFRRRGEDGEWSSWARATLGIPSLLAKAEGPDYEVERLVGANAVIEALGTSPAPAVQESDGEEDEHRVDIAIRGAREFWDSLNTVKETLDQVNAKRVTVSLTRDEARALLGDYDEAEHDINCGIPGPGEAGSSDCDCGAERDRERLLNQAECKVKAALSAPVESDGEREWWAYSEEDGGRFTAGTAQEAAQMWLDGMVKEGVLDAGDEGFEIRTLPLQEEEVFFVGADLKIDPAPPSPAPVSDQEPEGEEPAAPTLHEIRAVAAGSLRDARAGRDDPMGSGAVDDPLTALAGITAMLDVACEAAVPDAEPRLNRSELDELDERILRLSAQKDSMSKWELGHLAGMSDARMYLVVDPSGDLGEVSRPDPPPPIEPGQPTLNLEGLDQLDSQIMFLHRESPLDEFGRGCLAAYEQARGWLVSPAHAKHAVLNAEEAELILRGCLEGHTFSNGHYQELSERIQEKCRAVSPAPADTSNTTEEEPSK